MENGRVVQEGEGVLPGLHSLREDAQDWNGRPSVATGSGAGIEDVPKYEEQIEQDSGLEQWHADQLPCRSFGLLPLFEAWFGCELSCGKAEQWS